VAGLELYSEPDADQVLEVLSTGQLGSTGVPKEMLTDRGGNIRTGGDRRALSGSWGRIGSGILNRPHHPMTLGKVERFWKDDLRGIFVRAQFGSFEEAQEKNPAMGAVLQPQAPHQGIGGLCPADRYFESRGELRKTIERGITGNVLEMGVARNHGEPFYMVGRMEGQSVVLRAERGNCV